MNANQLNYKYDRSKVMPHSVKELVDLYKDTSSGHFFDQSTMRFFKSRITENYYRVNDKVMFFITTEKGPMPDSPRLASIRKAEIVNTVRDDGTLVSKIKIETVGDFNEMSLAKAKRELTKLNRE